MTSWHKIAARFGGWLYAGSLAAFLCVSSNTAAQSAGTAKPESGDSVATNPHTHDPENVDELKAELERLRARERERTTVINVIQTQQQQQVVQETRARPRVYTYSAFDLRLLTPREQERYWTLERSNRRIAFPLVATIAGGAGTLAVFFAYAVLEGTTCYDEDLDEYVDCSMAPGALGFAVIPVVVGVVGTILLAKRVHRRRAFRSLTRKGTRVVPMVGSRNTGIGMSLAF